MINGKNGLRFIMGSYVVYGHKYPYIPSLYRSDYDCVDALTIEEAIKKYNKKPNNQYFAYSARCIMYSENWHLPSSDFKKMRTSRYWRKKHAMQKLEEDNPHLDFSSWKKKLNILKNSKSVKTLLKEFYIYFLLYKHNIIYIGQTNNFITRLKTHQKRITFDRYCIQKFECTEKEIKLIESELILHYKPIKNEVLK